MARAEGDFPEARKVLATSAAAYPLSEIEEDLRPYLDLAEAYALAGDSSSARSYLARADAQGRHDFTLNYDQKRRTTGLIAMAEGRFAEAITTFQEASRFGQCSTCLLFDLGLAQEKAGLTDKAAETYRRYIRQAPFALGRGEQLGFVLTRLAAIQDKVGDTHSAQVTRAQLDRHWTGADIKRSVSALETGSN